MNIVKICLLVASVLALLFWTYGVYAPPREQQVEEAADERVSLPSTLSLRGSLVQRLDDASSNVVAKTSLQDAPYPPSRQPNTDEGRNKN